MTRLIAIADTHCRFDLLQAIIARELAEDLACPAVLHAGDVGLYDRDSMERLPARERRLIVKHGNPIELAFDFMAGEAQISLPLVGIPGNHEDFHLVERLEDGRLELPGLHLLAAGSCQELSLGERTVRVMGLGRIAPFDFSSKKARKAKYFDEAAIELTAERGEALRPDILLLHDPPLLQVEGQRRSFGCGLLNGLIERLQPSLVLAGHMHFEYRSLVAGVPVVGLGYGARGRYAVIDGDLQLTFRDLQGRPAAPRCVEAVALAAPAVPKRERNRRARLQRQRLPITGRQVLERFGLRLRKRDRRTLERLFAELRQQLVENGELTEAEAWARAESFVAEHFSWAASSEEE